METYENPIIYIGKNYEERLLPNFSLWTYSLV